MQNISTKRHLITIFITIALDMIGVGIVIPIIPYLFDGASQYYLLPNSWNINKIYIWQGLSLALYPLCQFIFAPILGEYSDHIGRKKILILSIFGTFLGYMLTGYAIATHSIWLFLLGRLIDGSTAGNISIAMASIADVSENKDKAKNFGLVSAAFGIGFVVGPALGGILSKHFGLSFPFYFAAILGILNIALIWMFLKETLKKPDGKTTIHPLTALENVVGGFKMPELRNIFTINVFYVASFACYTAFAGVYLKERFHLDLDQVGYYFAVIGVCIALTQAFVVRRVFKKFEDKNILLTGLLCYSIIILAFIFSNSIWINVALAPLFTICIGLSNSAINAITSKSATPEIQGRIIGISSSLAAISNAIPQFLAGVFAAVLGFIAPFYITIILAMIAIYFAFKLKK